MSNAAENSDILTTGVWTFYIIILIVQQNYFSDLYSAKILNLSARPFFPCIFNKYAEYILKLYLGEIYISITFEIIFLWLLRKFAHLPEG